MGAHHNYFLQMSHKIFDMRENEMHVHRKHVEEWRVTLVETGAVIINGGRIPRVAEYLDPTAPFCFTDGLGVSDINVDALIENNKS